MVESIVIEIFSVTILLLMLCFTGVILNTVLLVVFIKHPETRTPENILLIHLCISDILYVFSFIIFPITAWVRGVPCLYFIFWRSFLVALNVYTVLAICIQRYIALRRLRIKLSSDQNDYRKTWVILSGVWVTSFIVAALEVALLANKLRFCFEDLYNGLPLYRMITFAIIPSLIIAVCYISSACRINRSACPMPGAELNSTLETLRERRRRSARILIAVVGVFAITYLPFFIYLYLWSIYLKLLSAHTWLTLMMFVTSVLNPVFNPIALCLASTQLRQLYKKYCCCCCCCCRQLPRDSVLTLITAETQC